MTTFCLFHLFSQIEVSATGGIPPCEVTFRSGRRSDTAEKLWKLSRFCLDTTATLLYWDSSALDFDLSSSHRDEGNVL